METTCEQRELSPAMNTLGHAAFGCWSGGRFMHFGEVLDESHWIACVQRAYERGLRTFITADVYGTGRCDSLLAEALAGIDRDSYQLVGAIGHDFYEGSREGSKGYARFTDSRLRPSEQYGDFLRMATEKSLERLRSDHFDLLLLHNPDATGFEHPLVWQGMSQLKQQGLTRAIGIAPGPANGFTLDMLSWLERYGEAADWAMLILNPIEPWPGRLALEACARAQVQVITRVVDHGGTLLGDVRPGHQLRPGDHRAFRPEGWIERAWEKMQLLEPIRQDLGLSWMHFACQWNLSHPAVRCVVPTLIAESEQNANAANSYFPVEEKIDELARLAPECPISAELREQIAALTDNIGCMALKGASARIGADNDRPDQWPLASKHREVAKRWQIEEAYASELT